MDRSWRLASLILMPLIVLSTLLQWSSPVAAQDLAVEGLLGGSSREFQASEMGDGTIYLSFAVIEFDSVAHAEDGIYPFSRDTLDTLTASGLTLSSSTTVAPDVRESTLAWKGTTLIEGYTLDTAILLFRDGRYLHIWIAWAQGFAPNPLLDLATIAEQFYRDKLPLYERDGAANRLDMVPAVSDLPPGFVLSSETKDLAADWENAPSS